MIYIYKRTQMRLGPHAVELSAHRLLHVRLPVWGSLLIAAATLARALAGLSAYDPQPLLLFASACWGGAFGLLLVLLIRVRARPRRPEAGP